MRYIFFIFIVIVLVECTNDDIINSNIKLTDGYYMGTFQYDTLRLWESFGIKTDSFEEYASGGVMYQKFPQFCLTKGTYEIISDSIYFDNIQIAQPPNKINCDEDYLLMGNYYVDEFTDSTILFWRSAKRGRQDYYLKLYYTSE